MTNQIYDATDKVITVVYDTGRDGQHCFAPMQAILAQTHGNLELLVLDRSGTPDVEKDCIFFDNERLHYLACPEGCSAWQAWQLAWQNAQGDYFVFLQGEETPTWDFCRLLLKTALARRADAVMGLDVCRAGEDSYQVQSMAEALLSFDTREGAEILKRFGESGADSPTVHRLANKLWSRSVVADAMEVLAGDGVLPQCRDEEQALLLVIRLFAAATRLASCRAAVCVVPQGQSTAALRVPALQESLQAWEKMGHGAALQDAFWQRLSHAAQHPIFDSFAHGWGNMLEWYKQVILEQDWDCISFDLFDTLVVRPTGNPLWVFRFLDKKYRELVNGQMDFHQIRVKGEAGARAELARIHPEWEDVTLAEIYEYIGRTFRIEPDVCQALMEEEIRQEVRLCRRRAQVCELFEVAVRSGKPVVITSDMYLPRQALAAILDANGYTGYRQIFVSSEARRLKTTGHLYDTLLETTHAAPDKVLHFGDNWGSDVEWAGKKGIQGKHIPANLALFDNTYGEYPTGKRNVALKKACGTFLDEEKTAGSVGLRSMEALIANRWYENPFHAYPNGTTVGCNPYLWGYGPVGMHVVGVVRWLVQQVKRRNPGKLWFAARDGWVFMQAYEQYRAYHPELPPSGYLYVSRKSLLPGMVDTMQDFFDLPVDFYNYTPRKLLHLLDFCVRSQSEAEREALLSDCPVPPDQTLVSDWDFQRFINFFLDRFYDRQRHRQSLQAARAYLERLQPGDLVFDMGYSGRIQATINRLVGFRVDALFIHDSERCADLCRSGGFGVECYYDFAPKLPDMIREYLLSDFGPTCVGYRQAGDQAEPVLMQESNSAEERFLLRTLHNGALDFAADFFRVIQGDWTVLPFHPMEVSLPMEGMVAAMTEQERGLFGYTYFDDAVYSSHLHNSIAGYIEEYYLPSLEKKP